MRQPPKIQPGPLSQRQAEELNDFLRTLLPADGVSVAPPLSAARTPGGVGVFLQGFVPPSDPGTLTVVTNVCIDWPSQTATVEYTTFRLSTGEALRVVCVDNPTGCCAESGSGSGSGTVESDCCPGVALPASVAATFGGSLSSLGTVTLVYDSFLGFWYAAGVPAPCDPDAAAGVYVKFICVPGVGWALQGVVADPESRVLFDQGGVTADSCSPLAVNFSGTISGSPGCNGDWTAAIDGSSGGGGGGGTACCPDGLPFTLYATVAGCSDMDGTYALTSGGGGTWSASARGPGNAPISLTLSCVAGSWTLSGGCGFGGGHAMTFTLTSADCDAPEIVFGGTAPGGNTCCGGSSFTVTITD